MQARHLWKQSLGAAFCALLVANALLPGGKPSGGEGMSGVKPTTTFATIKLEAQDFESPIEPEQDKPVRAAKIERHEALPTGKGPRPFLGLNDGVMNILTLAAGAPDEKAADSFKPLSSENAALYRDIFRLQAYGRMNRADEKIARLTDRRLLSDVLYQRYMHPVAYRSTYEELSAWLQKYPSHPEADKIERLALSRKPAGMQTDWPKIKARGELPGMREPLIASGKSFRVTGRSAEQEQAVSSLTARVKSLISEGETGLAMETLFTNAGVQYMAAAESDTLRALAAQKLLYGGHVIRARELAREAAGRSGEKVPLAAWIAGLSYWQEGNYNAAANYFSIAGASPYASGWMSSGAAYWAGRSYAKAGNRSQTVKWYALAAKQERTFYGLLASQALGRKPALDWRDPPYAYKDEQKLLSTPEGRRAAALVASGQYDLAENELLHFNFKAHPEMRRIALAYAAHVGLPSLAMRLGSRSENARVENRPYDSAVYPLMPWEPRRGFTVDPALIHAIVRQESRFDPQAQSYSGASGLMQIMPATARHILRGVNVADADIPALLRRPADNLTLGQSYVRELLADKNVNGDILSMLVAYNAGPGNLARWKQKYGEIEDPLMFVEMIPVDETRTYVKRVMAFYWIYSNRGGPGGKTLEALAAGKPARYAALSEDATASSKAFKLAANQ